MLNHKYWLNEFKENPGWNDTGGQVTVETEEGATWIVLGVHRLTEEERPSHPTVFFDVRCVTRSRDGMKPVYWGWTTMQPHQNPSPAFVDRSPYNVGNIAIMSGMVISMWLDDGDRVSGFQGDDSYFIVFQEVDTSVLPDPDRLIHFLWK